MRRYFIPTRHQILERVAVGGRSKPAYQTENLLAFEVPIKKLTHPGVLRVIARMYSYVTTPTNYCTPYYIYSTRCRKSKPQQRLDLLLEIQVLLQEYHLTNHRYSLLIVFVVAI